MKIQNTNINFKSGLTNQMKNEINRCDVGKISEMIRKSGIPNDFKGNKVIAWCTLQCLDIINNLNYMYNLKLGLPKGIFVEDFKRLKVQDKNATGFLNFAPAKLHINQDKTTPEKTIFFNEFAGFNYSGGNEYWNRIDKMADENFDCRLSSTDFFLEPILHEFSHVIHEENLISKLGGKELVKLLAKTLNPYQLRNFQAKYGNMLEKICSYAAENPFEAVACDLSKRTIENLDKDLLSPQDNFIKQSPYKKQPMLKKMFIFEPESRLNRTLRRLWNGKME